MLAAALVLGGNALLVADGASVRNDSRQLSFRIVQSEIADLPERPLDLVVFGDSRGRQLDAAELCRALYDGPSACFNASSVAGDWVTTELHRRALGARLDSDTVVIVAPSEYWLEMGGLERGLIPATTVYASLGQDANTVASFFPLSRERGRLMNDLHRRLRLLGWAWLGAFTGEVPPTSLDARREAEMPEIAGWAKSHVDHWFAPIDEPDRAVREEAGRRVLARLAEGGRRVAVVDLAKPPVRNAYVDRYYPGRRARYRETLERLCAEQGIPYLPLDGQFTAWSAYRDFHHFTNAVLPYVHQRLAASLRTLQGMGFAPRRPIAPTPPAS